MISTDTITVAPEGSVTYDARLELRGARRLIDPVAQFLLTRASNKTRNSLADKLSRL